MTAMMQELGLRSHRGQRGHHPGISKSKLPALQPAILPLLALALEGARRHIKRRTDSKDLTYGFHLTPTKTLYGLLKSCLTDEYFYSLKDHAIPFDFRALKAPFKNKPRAQDIYLWMTQRLCRIDERKPLLCAGRISMKCLAVNPRSKSSSVIFLKIS